MGETEYDSLRVVRRQRAGESGREKWRERGRERGREGELKR